MPNQLPPNELPQDELCNAWQKQPVENITMPLEEIRRRAGKFQHRIWWRNAREYAAIVVVVIVFGYYFKLVPGLVARAGAVMTIAGALFVAYQLHRRASSETAPPQPNSSNAWDSIAAGWNASATLWKTSGAGTWAR